MIDRHIQEAKGDDAIKVKATPALGPDGSSGLKLASQLTVIVPAYNEAATIRDTIRSLQQQTTPPKEIIVVDDCSTDRTGDIARELGVTVIRCPQNTGSKGGAMNFGLDRVQTQLTATLDADTLLAPDGIETMLRAFIEEDPPAAACGFVIPRYVRTIWERGRYIEYLLSLTFHKPIQDYYGRIVVVSGCCAIYQTEVLRALGGWSSRTVAEDMDLTWTMYKNGYHVRFVPESVCFPIEPHNLPMLRRQLRRWQHGYVQNLVLHFRDLIRIPYLRAIISLAIWDAVMAPLMYAVLIPLVTFLFTSPIFLLGYSLELPILLIPVLSKAVARKELRRALASLPAFYVLRLLNSIWLLEAFWTELVVGRRLQVFEKGH